MFSGPAEVGVGLGRTPDRMVRYSWVDGRGEVGRAGIVPGRSRWEVAEPG